MQTTRTSAHTHTHTHQRFGNGFCIQFIYFIPYDCQLFYKLMTPDFSVNRYDAYGCVCVYVLDDIKRPYKAVKLILSRTNIAIIIFHLSSFLTLLFLFLDSHLSLSMMIFIFDTQIFFLFYYFPFFFLSCFLWIHSFNLAFSHLFSFSYALFFFFLKCA